MRRRLFYFMRRSGNYIKNIFFSAIIFVLFFALAELTCRFFIFFECGKFIYERNFEYDSDKIYRLKRNHRGIFLGKPLKTNAFGYRDKEIPVEKSENTIRILAIGDSIAFGHGVFASETFPEQLELMLNKNATRYHFDVINTAASGNAPFHEYFDLKRGLEFKPDIVIIQFTLNDVVEPYWVYRRYGGRGVDYHQVDDLPLKYLAYLNDCLKTHSMFYYFLRRGLLKMGRDRAIQREVYNVENLVRMPEHPKIKVAWGECLTWMKRITDLCREKGINCILVISPYQFQIALDASQAHPQMMLKEFALEENIKYIDLLPLFKEEIKKKIIEKYSLKDTEYIDLLPDFKDKIEGIWYEYFLDNDHYTPQGHVFVAEYIYSVVQDVLKEF